MSNNSKNKMTKNNSNRNRKNRKKQYNCKTEKKCNLPNFFLKQYYKLDNPNKKSTGLRTLHSQPLSPYFKKGVKIRVTRMEVQGLASHQDKGFFP